MMFTPADVPKTPLTNFAPAGRAGLTTLLRSRQQLQLDELLPSLLEGIPFLAMVLNQQRQILAVNSRLLKSLKIEDVEALIGLRPGEAVGCVFSGSGPDGCGSDQHCTQCGAVKAVLECQQSNLPVAYEASIMTGGAALDVEMLATPTVVAGEPIILCVLKDISAEKRRQVLEKVFFHDVLNTAGGIRGIASLLNGTISAPEREHEYLAWIVQLSDRLIDEINSQRKLLDAEQGVFCPEIGLVLVPDLLEGLRRLYSSHDVANGRHVVVAAPTECCIMSDGSILHRILGNLLKNALEAAVPGDTVTLAACTEADTITFTVHNPGAMPEKVRLQLFQRSFSTKGTYGRGIGTYSVKLFAERYLQGRVLFTSTREEGTTFSVTFPKVIASEETRLTSSSH